MKPVHAGTLEIQGTAGGGKAGCECDRPNAGGKEAGCESDGHGCGDTGQIHQLIGRRPKNNRCPVANSK